MTGASTTGRVRNARRTPWRRQAVAFIGAAALVLVGSLAVDRQPAGAGASGAPFSATETVTRTNVNADGTQQLVDSRKTTVTVSQTDNLRGRQEINVSWTGAHPTGGVVADVNSGGASDEEYPFVLLECRGVDSTTVAVADQLSPQTCWTQTSQERYQDDYNTAFPPYRIDRYADGADRAAIVNQPDPLPNGCFTGYLAAHWVPFVAANGTKYYGGAGGCGGQPPEAANVEGAGLPSNTTYGVTAADGSGSAAFDVFTDDENASLGCSDTVPCALVAIPIMGVSCDAYNTTLPTADQPPADEAAADDAACRAQGQYQPGQQFNAGIQPDLSVTGQLWWTASNWRNRITIPLEFAVPSSVCSVVNSGPSLNIYGSVLMAEVAAQWEPKFCTDPGLFNFTVVQTGDSAARNLLTSGTIEGALSSAAPPTGYGRPVVQAPVAVTGFAITYDIDGTNGNPYPALRLTPRLLAKLLTESYPADPAVRDNYPALAHNPMNITQDPEFIALNPGIPRLTNEAAAELINISSEADLTYALTSYINADPEARAWLDGHPDPWGMVVNPNYKGISLPVSSWPLLDDFQLPQSFIDSDVNPCYSYSPSPWLSLIADPTALLSNISLDMQFALSNVNVVCNGNLGDISTLKMLTQGRQSPGFRFLIGVSSLGEVARYDLTPAKLQTTANVSSPTTQFTDAEGRTFVAPTTTTLGTASRLLTPDDATGVWNFPYGSLHSGGAADQAYPGTMVVYADVPTSGLATTDAGKLATLLRYAAGPGQQPGMENGQLPPGYLPMTSANGLSRLATYTTRAADAVAAQTGQVPLVDGSVVATTPTRPIGATRVTPSTTATEPPISTKNVLPVAGKAVNSPRPTSKPSSRSAASSTAQPAPVPAALVSTIGAHSALSARVVPALLALTILSALAAAGLRYGYLFGQPAALVRRWRPTRPAIPRRRKPGAK